MSILSHDYNFRPLDAAEWEQHSGLALRWVLKSIAVNDGNGSSHSYSPLFGWSKAYPETTGYLIETLLQYGQLRHDPELIRAALSCADWLLSIQLPNGAFAGLLAGNTRPSVFNTTQIMFGFAALIEFAASGQTLQTIDHPERYRAALERAFNWALSILEPDGSWRQAAFVPGFVPSYYTRALQGMLAASRVLQTVDKEYLIQNALGFYARRFLPNHALLDAGFQAGKPAFTHTLAYALEGFFQTALYFENGEILASVKQTMAVLLRLQQEKGKLAGSYDPNWKGDYSFTCVTGSAQLSLLSHQIYRHTGEGAFQQFSETLLLEACRAQVLTGSVPKKGALPGSVPFYGKYLPFRYPNWAVKFLLDALLPYAPGQDSKGLV